MEVIRAREKGQGERELRRSVEATTVTLYSGGFEGAWVAARREVAAGREGEKEGGAARQWRGRKCACMVGAVGSGSETREKSGEKKDEWIRRHGGAAK